MHSHNTCNHSHQVHPNSPSSHSRGGRHIQRHSFQPDTSFYNSSTVKTFINIYEIYLGFFSLLSSYICKADLTNDQRKFLLQLHDDKLVKYRHVLYDHYCSKRGDAQALDNDNDYDIAVSILDDRYANIAYELREHQNFEKLVVDGDWAAIIKCNNASPKRKKTHIKELVKRAEEGLRNVTINTDPCK